MENILDSKRQIAWEYLDVRWNHGAEAVVASGMNEEGSTTLRVKKLTVEIPKDIELKFPNDEYVYTIKKGKVGDTTLTCKPMENAREDGDIGYFDALPDVPGRFVEAETVMVLLADGRMVPSEVRSGKQLHSFGRLAVKADENEGPNEYSLTEHGLF